VQRWSSLMRPGGLALDFACGAGRNLPPLRERGARIVAADRDEKSLELLAHGYPDVQCVCTDLENGPWPFTASSVDALVCCNYLHRARLDLMVGLLAPGGILIYETFALGNERHGRPSNPAFLLAEGELLRVASRNGLVTLGYEHGFTGPQRPAIVQRLCAVRPPFVAETYPLVG
jgi:SAM-dependent methyltransferase